jgi:hypothetical protein
VIKNRIALLLLFSFFSFSSRAELTISERTKIKIEGKLLAGKGLKEKIGKSLILKLTPADEGWDLDVCDSHKHCQFVPVANPPYRFGAKVFEIYGWHFRNAENSGSNNGSTNAPGLIRDVSFVTNYEDFKIAERAFLCGQNSTGSPCESPEKALADLGKLKMGTLHLELSELKLSAPQKEQPVTIKSLIYKIEVN